MDDLVPELLLGLLDGVVGLGELVIGLIEAYLQPLQFLTVVTDVTYRPDMNRTFGQKRAENEIWGKGDRPKSQTLK